MRFIKLKGGHFIREKDVKGFGPLSPDYIAVTDTRGKTHFLEDVGGDEPHLISKENYDRLVAHFTSSTCPKCKSDRTEDSWKTCSSCSHKWKEGG